MKRLIFGWFALAAILCLVAGTASAQGGYDRGYDRGHDRGNDQNYNQGNYNRGDYDRNNLDRDVRQTLEDALQTDPSLQRFINQSAGYAVFPRVGAGAFIVGGAYGNGEVIQNDQLAGLVNMTQGNIGIQIGGQEYSELIFFRNPRALDDFKRGVVRFSARASAVALHDGAAAQTRYRRGVAVFTLGERGLMIQASIGGQHFHFTPVGEQYGYYGERHNRRGEMRHERGENRSQRDEDRPQRNNPGY